MLASHHPHHDRSLLDEALAFEHNVADMDTMWILTFIDLAFFFIAVIVSTITVSLCYIHPWWWWRSGGGA